MKKSLLIVMIFLLSITLSGCNTVEEDDFVYFDGYFDEEAKHFEQYSIVYRSDEYNLTIYAVKDSNIRDESNNEFINYIIKRDVLKLDGLSLSCSNHFLTSGSHSWIGGGFKTELITGQEVFDYCQDSDFFTLDIKNEDSITITKVTSENQNTITWNNTSDITEINVANYITSYSKLGIRITIAVLIFTVIAITYNFIYKKNYNNFTKNLKVRKLPNLSIVNIVLIILLFITSLLIINEYEGPTTRSNNNFYDYVIEESHVSYLSEFANNGYELLKARGNLEIYMYSEDNDNIRFYTVLVDGDNRYTISVNEFSYPYAADVDFYEIELRQKESQDNGIIFGYVLSAFTELNEEVNYEFSLSLAVTRNVDGAPVFVDFLDTTDNFQVYYKNANGYYYINYNMSLVFTAE